MKAGASVDCLDKIHEYDKKNPGSNRDERQEERLKNNKDYQCIYRTIIDNSYNQECTYNLLKNTFSILEKSV